ncbi:GNAT family N-acetyltransferase [Candidatus Sodalis sp. SoCistrobi]|uniref:GNAT family N-acetyltransferase n=1 Tax=Candidatus Sodalis sp. SoCistrobi TaxID=1922216 RepID=UPI00093ED1E5|nr:GNAT family N-acetyltransferase [Candidatus Sodalis sp. SoCistrobi]
MCRYLCVDGQDIGLAKLLCEMPRPDTGALGGQLKKIYFLREFTGRGYGKPLFSAVEMLAREARQSQLWLEVLPQNQQAKTFYESQQMAVSGETAYESGSRYTPLLILSKTL